VLPKSLYNILLPVEITELELVLGMPHLDLLRATLPNGGLCYFLESIEVSFLLLNRVHKLYCLALNCRQLVLDEAFVEVKLSTFLTLSQEVGNE